MKGNIKYELFNQDMVQAFLENRKFRTSRPIKPRHKNDFIAADFAGKPCEWKMIDIDARQLVEICKPKYKPGDIMCVRETWRIQSAHRFEAEIKIEYKADGKLQIVPFDNRNQYDDFITKWDKKGGCVWIPSIFMPEKIARIFNLVQKSRVQRLEDVTEKDAVEDGFQNTLSGRNDGAFVTCIGALENFKKFWTQQYGTESRWMWVYYLKRISKEEILNAEK